MSYSRVLNRPRLRPLPERQPTGVFRKRPARVAHGCPPRRIWSCAKSSCSPSRRRCRFRPILVTMTSVIDSGSKPVPTRFSGDRPKEAEEQRIGSTERRGSANCGACYEEPSQRLRGASQPHLMATMFAPIASARRFERASPALGVTSCTDVMPSKDHPGMFRQSSSASYSRPRPSCPVMMHWQRAQSVDSPHLLHSLALRLSQPVASEHQR